MSMFKYIKESNYFLVQQEAFFKDKLLLDCCCLYEPESKKEGVITL
jgi:hypothetical protein